MNEMITVVIPFKNNRNELSLAIKSTLTQTYPHFKILLIDDGSSDGSLQLAREFESYGQVRVLSDGRSVGLPARLNESLNYVESKYLARMDADDIQHPERLRLQIESLKTMDADLVCSGYYRFTDKTENIVGCSNYKDSRFLNKGDVIKGGAILHPSVFGKTEWFKNNLYDETFLKAQDQELWMRTIERSNFFRMEEPLVYYRVNPELDFLKVNKTLRSLASLYKKHGVYSKWISNYCKALFYLGLENLRIGKSYFRSRNNNYVPSVDTTLEFKSLLDILR